MTDSTFKPGDLVRLKSGGPVMTVDIECSGGALQCKWFDGSAEKDGTFRAATLILADD